MTVGEVQDAEGARFVPHYEWFSVMGALLVTLGSAVRAYREIWSFRRFYETVLAAQERILNDEVRRLMASTEIWQFWRRSALRDRVRREGEHLLTEDERAQRRDIDLAVLA